MRRIFLFMAAFFLILASGVMAQDTDSLWSALMKQGGCLTGGQYMRDGRFGGEGCVMGRMTENGTYIPSRVGRDRGKGWEMFFGLPRAETGVFLIGKMASGDSTQIHTCPFFTAIEGEVAVYALQAISGKNWMDFDRFAKYREREITGSADNHQAWLQAVLRSPDDLHYLQAAWRRELTD